MSKTELSIELEADVAKDALAAAKSSDMTTSEWIGAAVERALATELGLTGVDELHDELEDELEVPADIEAEFGDAILATP